MSDPTRWLKDESAPPEAVEFLRALHPPKPAPSPVRALLAQRFAEMAAPAQSTLAAAFWFKTALVSTGLLVGSAVVYTSVRHTSVSESAAVVPAFVAPVGAAEAPPLPSLSTDQVDAVIENQKPVSAGRALAAPSPGPASARRSTPDTLAGEESILEQARQSVASAPGRALTLLGSHQRRYPNGELTAERLFLRVDALTRLGRTADARRDADTLIRRFPASAYARLAPGLLTSAAPTAKR
jgi:hypothetical protein